MARQGRLRRIVLLLLFGLVVTGVCVRAAIWQMDRLHQRRAFNAAVRRGLHETPRPVTDLVAGGGSDPDALVYRRVSATGTFDVAHEVLVYGRSLGERPGYGVLTPLVLADGRAVLVERGWVPASERTAPVADAAPPTGTVRVVGYTVPTRSGDDVSGDIVAGIDPGAMASVVGTPLLPVGIQLQTQDPSQPGALPTPLRPPVLTEGPHLNYVYQWSIFATIAVLGTVILIRREVKSDDASFDSGEPPAGSDVGGASRDAADERPAEASATEGRNV